jgi:hypothetical protein
MCFFCVLYYIVYRTKGFFNHKQNSNLGLESRFLFPSSDPSELSSTLTKHCISIELGVNGQNRILIFKSAFF